MFKVFLIIFVVSLAEEGSGFETKVLHFHMLQKHPNLKKCVSSIIHENTYVGVRVSEKTGECERLKYTWSEMEPGHAYAKKLYDHETFHPPVDWLDLWKIPGVLDSGARLDMSIEIQKPEELDFKIELYGALDIIFKFTDKLSIYGITVGGNLAVERHTALPAAFTSKGVVKVSILAHSDSITMLVENEEFTVPDNNVRSLFLLSVYPYYGIRGTIRVHHIEFTGK